MENTFATAPDKPVSRHAVSFVLITVFLDMVGFGLIMPVLPKLIVSFMGDDVGGAWMIGIFGFVWALAQFFASPVLGALSAAHRAGLIHELARFGHEPIRARVRRPSNRSAAASPPETDRATPSSARE